MDNLKQVDEVDKVEGLQDLQEVDFEENNKELVENFVKPKVGMCFNSLDEMFKYYKAYSLQNIPVMQRSCKKGDDESIRHVTFTCG